MNLTTYMTVERDDKEIYVEIEASYTPGRPAVWYHKDGSGSPAEPAEVEIFSVKDEDGNEVELTSDEEDRAIEKLLDEACE